MAREQHAMDSSEFEKLMEEQRSRSARRAEEEVISLS